MPAAKKHPSTRRRRNSASTAAVLRPVGPDERRPLPPLPSQRFDDETGKKIRWLQVTRDWWKALWAAPMSKEYDDSDLFQLYVLADLYDRYWRKPTVSRAAEIRQQRALFGMTPYDRRRLEWTIEVAEDAKDRGTRRRGGQPGAAEQPPEGEDPRTVLTMA